VKKNGKKLQDYLTYMEFEGFSGNAKSNGHTNDISKFLLRMNEQPLKVPAP